MELQKPQRLKPRERAPLGSIKGSAFREFIHWCYAELGPDAMGMAIARVESSIRSQLVTEDPWLGIIASRWYDARVVHGILDGLTDGFDDARRYEVAQSASHAVMDKTLRGLYKVLFDWMATPGRYAKYSAKLWDAYYDCGEFDVTMRDERTAVCTIREWHSHHPVICDLNQGAAAAIYKAMGCRDVEVVRQTCVSAGGLECRFVTSWADVVG